MNRRDFMRTTLGAAVTRLLPIGAVLATSRLPRSWATLGFTRGLHYWAMSDRTEAIPPLTREAFDAFVQEFLSEPVPITPTPLMVSPKALERFATYHGLTLRQAHARLDSMSYVSAFEALWNFQDDRGGFRLSRL